MSLNLILPIANKDVSLVKGAPILLGNNQNIRSIKPEHYGAILSYMPSLQTEIFPRTKCIIVNDVDQNINQEYVRAIQIAAAFSLNFFAEEGSLLIGRGFVISSKRAFKVTRDFEFSTALAINSASVERFRLLKSTKPVDIQRLFESSAISIARDRTLHVTLSRFNSAVSKTQIEDQAIDLSICLESVFSSQTEVAFRFALYNTLLSVQDLAQRLEPFKLLKRLYKDRSNIVHGSVVQLNWSKEDWGGIL